MTAKRLRQLNWVLSLYIACVFVQSLFFKFTGSPETDHIFSTLDAWAAGLTGIAGLFAPGGVFSAHAVGGAELVASALLLAGLALGRPLLHGAGAAVALGVISGAIYFHLFTPLGIAVMGDGGLLFAMACGIWLAAAAMLILNRGALKAALGR